MSVGNDPDKAGDPPAGDTTDADDLGAGSAPGADKSKNDLSDDELSPSEGEQEQDLEPGDGTVAANRELLAPKKRKASELVHDVVPGSLPAAESASAVDLVAVDEASGPVSAVNAPSTSSLQGVPVTTGRVLESSSLPTESAASVGTEVVTVAMSLVDALLDTGNSGGVPIGAPAEWVLLAAARRKLADPETADPTLAGNASTASVSDLLMADEDGNRAPIVNLSYVGRPGWITGSVSGDVNTWDPDWDRYTYATSAPTKGSVRINRLGQFTYTPTATARHAAAATGATEADKTDSFTVTVTDSHGAATILTVSVDVGPANRTPSARVITVTDPAPSTGTVTGVVAATDRDGDTLTFTGPTSTRRGTVVVNTDGTFAYTPTTEARQAARSFWNRSDSFRVAVTDGHGGTDSVLVRVAIAPAPANTAPGNGQVTRNPAGANGVVTGSVSATDPDGDALSYTGSTTTAKGAATVNADGSFTYTPTGAARHAAAATNAATTGANRDSFTVTVSDGRGGTLSVAVSVDISPQNTAPTGATATAGTAAADGAVSGTVTATDSDKDTLTYALGATAPVRGEVTVNANGTFTYRPTAVARHAAAADGAPEAVKNDAFSVIIRDGHGGVTTLTVPVSVSPHNANPEITGQNPSAPDAGGLVTGTVTATDRDGDSLVFSGPTTSARGGTVTVMANGSFSYRPSDQARLDAAQTAGTDTDSFTVTVVDGHGGTAAALVTVTVAPAEATPNRAPTASPTVGVADPDSWIVRGSLGAVDPDGDALTYQLQLPPRRGQVYLDALGNFEYKPSAMQAIEAYRQGSAQPESFTVSISDGVNAPIVVTVSGLPIEPAEAAVTRVATLPGTQITISSDGQLLFSVRGNGVDVYNARTLEGYGGWSVGGFVTGTAVAPNRTAYTISAVDNDVRVYNAVTAERLTTITVPGGEWNTIWARGNRVYVSDGVAVSAIDISTNTVVPVTGPVIQPSGQRPYAMGTLRAYVADSAGGEHFISIVDRSTGIVTDKVFFRSGGFSVIDLDLNPSGDLLYATTMGGLEIITLAVPDRLDPNPLAAPPPSPTDPDATPPKPTPLKPVSPLKVTQIDYSTGTLRGTITAPGEQPGSRTRYEGSTSGALGNLTVSPDGSFSFAPSTLARQYAADSGRIGRVAFIIKAIRADGSHTWLPVNVPLVPAGLPTEDVYPPVPLINIGGNEGLVSYPYRAFDARFSIDVTWANGDPYEKAFKADRDAYPDNLPKYAAENWKYSKALLVKDDTGLPVAQEIYIVSVLNVKAPGTSILGSVGERYVLGYRKMEQIGQFVTISNPTTSPKFDDDLTYISHVALAFAPGTFPHQRFKQRIPGVVGGNIFDNEITALQWDFLQYATGDAALSEQIDDITLNTELFGKQLGVAGDTAGEAAKGLYGGLGRPDRGDVAVLGVGVANGAIEIFDLEDQQKVDESYGAGASGLYYVMGPESNKGQAPPIGLPD
ncbi:Ig-like domain-containing protein [Mycobacterium sp. 236(2023)]|uniref:Ig-like domain-containing protein n=1 Tax=Mycobacterium sp. 236(2023) TaxID=3038163 RepID=UPI00241522FE|nr:Ig-like domain-containing protein [Mycobacterium sp. 236(2023)]MDG4668015.1 Ig-like domain-containing protein [Mycobacterium sp. 236(2023)]